jgi:hypothetical protein
MMPRGSHEAQRGLIISLQDGIDSGQRGPGGKQSGVVGTAADDGVGFDAAGTFFTEGSQRVEVFGAVKSRDLGPAGQARFPSAAAIGKPGPFEVRPDGFETLRSFGMSPCVVFQKQRIAKKKRHGIVPKGPWRSQSAS